MLKLAHHIPCSIETIVSGSFLDENIMTIQRYFAARQNEIAQDAKWVSLPPFETILELGVLGTPLKERHISERWGQEAIFPLRLYHSMVVLGPLCSPLFTHSPCPHCLDRRWAAIRPIAELKALQYASGILSSGATPKLTPFALEAIWNMLEAIWKSWHAPSTANEYSYPLYTLDLDTFQTATYALLQDPLCPSCAVPEPDTASEAVIELSHCPKSTISSYHTTSATDYPIPLKAYTNPVCGMLGTTGHGDYASTVAAPVTGVFKITSKYDVHDAWWSGHGNSYYQSRYLGLLEGLERYAGHISRRKYVSVFDSYEHLSDQALDPRKCGVYNNTFYRNSNPYCLPFATDQPIHWVWGYSFREQRPLLVPEQIVYYLDWRPEYAIFVQECSNGCATGSSIEEAMLHGLLELIERDAFLISWFAKLPLPRIDPYSSKNQETLFAADRIDKLGYDLHLFDMRLDIAVPSVMCVASRRNPGLGTYVYAAGASLDPEDAIRAALCEVACYVPGFDRRVQEKLPQLQRMAQDYTQVRDLPHHALLHGLPEMAEHSAFLFKKKEVHSVESFYQTWMQQRPQSLDLLDDLHYCMNQIMQLGMDIIVVDQTSPEQQRIGLKTASVIVPGLVPIDFGWHRQRILHMSRLRTVPRTAGFLATDFDPTSVKPVPHPFP